MHRIHINFFSFLLNLSFHNKQIPFNCHSLILTFPNLPIVYNYNWQEANLLKPFSIVNSTSSLLLFLGPRFNPVCGYGSRQTPTLSRRRRRNFRRKKFWRWPFLLKWHLDKCHFFNENDPTNICLQFMFLVRAIQFALFFQTRL